MQTWREFERVSLWIVCSHPKREGIYLASSMHAFFIFNGSLDSMLTVRHPQNCKMRMLTYMSIRDSIGELIDDGRMYEMSPALDSDQIRRTMIISQEIHDLLNGPWCDASWERRCFRLRATLQYFVMGKRIGVCLSPFEAAKAYMGRLHKVEDEVWDIRAIDPNPGIRVFGRFAEKDVFVAFLWSPRSVEVPASQRLPLGDKDSIQWKQAIKECKAEWRKVLPSYAPIHGGHPSDYIGSNFFSV